MRSSDWSSDVCSSDRMAAFAEAKPAAAKPGEVFNYSSATSVILADILADTLTPSQNPDARRAAMRDFIQGRLIEPPGMTSLTPEFDAQGRSEGSRGGKEGGSLCRYRW